MEETKTIIVTAVGSFSATAVVQGLHRAGFRVAATDINPRELIAVSAEAEVFRTVPRVDTGEPYMEALKRLIREEQASAVIPLTDVELDVLSVRREELLPAVLWSSPAETVRTARDKMQCSAAAAEVIAAFPGIRTIPAERYADLTEEELRKKPLPLIMKPDNGRSSEGLYRIRTEAERERALSGIRALPAERRQRFLVQPLIEGMVVTVDVVRDAEGHCPALPREEHTRTWNGAGLAVRVFRDPCLEAFCAALSDRLGILGSVNYEFVKDPQGKYWFLECNPRFSGGLGFSMAAGFDAVAEHARVFTEGSCSAAHGAKECRIARRYTEVITG